MYMTEHREIMDVIQFLLPMRKQPNPETRNNCGCGQMRSDVYMFLKFVNLCVNNKIIEPVNGGC